MSYVKQNFVDGQTLTAAQLNHMEAGIANAAGTQGEKGDKGDKGDTCLLYTSPSPRDCS